MLACVFPGQGSQKVGMGRDLSDHFPEARKVFEEVEDALHQPLTKMMFHGPEDALTLTRNAQPAIMAHSIAALRVLEKELGKPLPDVAACTAGHSLGEYSALVAAGALDLATCASLLRIRGSAMQEAVAPGKGAMAAILGLDKSAVEDICRDIGGVCDPANDNAPGQVVVSGQRKAVEEVADRARSAGARRVMFLSVSAPFHCRLMEPARRKMEEELKKVVFSPLTLPLIANVTAMPVADVHQIPDLLSAQVEACVRWRESIEKMCHDGVTHFIECGPGNVLGGLIRRISPQAKVACLGKVEDMDAMLSLISKL